MKYYVVQYKPDFEFSWFSHDDPIEAIVARNPRHNFFEVSL